jgi:hypothetical protein
VVICGLPISIEQIRKLTDLQQHFFTLTNHPQMWQFEDNQKVGAPQKGFTKFVRLANLPQMRQFEDLQFADPKILAVCGPNIRQA